MRIEADKWAKRLFREAVTLRPGEASVRQGWQEAIAGQTCPLSELWGTWQSDDRPSRTLDDICDKFGRDAIKRASLVRGKD